MDANEFRDRGYALNATFAKNVDGSATASVFANTAVAITGIFAFTVLCMGAMLTQQHGRPQDPHFAQAEGDGERPQDLQLAPVEDDAERSGS